MQSKRLECRSCGSPELEMVADFGLQPLAGFYPETVNKSLNHNRYPLVVDGCPVCGLLQITDLPPIAEVFHADYTYSSSQVAPLVGHFAEYAEWLSDRFPSDVKILEFGCNDGVLLDQLRLRDFTLLYGVDASANIVKVARQRGFDVKCGFFGTRMAQQIDEPDTFDLITCSNVFAHIDDLQDVILGARTLLKSTGEFCIEVHDAERLVAEGQFETVYHEHLTYFSADTLSTCLQFNGFEVVEVVKTSMHGGGLRIRARKSADQIATTKTHFNTETFSETGHTLLNRVVTCRNQVKDIFDRHGLIDGYGISGRAQMFLSMTKTSHYFGALYDDAAIRQGRFQVGTELSIQPYIPNSAAQTCIILAWNYAEAIFSKIASDYEAIYVLFPEYKRLK
jgi:2-polyprenyl-3-methyl-5-hydroxy-6-metoxy-1,4-benzoquinol methylase